jgi:hypothetical protein
MVNIAFKLAFAVLFMGAVISFMSQTGAISGAHAVSSMNITEDKWKTMVEPGNVTEGDGLEAQQDAYNAAGFSLKDFVIGAVYVKGPLDDFAQHQYPYTFATTLLQSLIYTVVMVSFIGWILNRTTT